MGCLCRHLTFCALQGPEVWGVHAGEGKRWGGCGHGVWPRWRETLINAGPLERPSITVPRGGASPPGGPSSVLAPGTPKYSHCWCAAGVPKGQLLLSPH